MAYERTGVLLHVGNCETYSPPPPSFPARMRKSTRAGCRKDPDSQV